MAKTCTFSGRALMVVHNFPEGLHIAAFAAAAISLNSGQVSRVSLPTKTEEYRVQVERYLNK